MTKLGVALRNFAKSPKKLLEAEWRYSQPALQVVNVPLQLYGLYRLFASGENRYIYGQIKLALIHLSA